MSQVSRNILPAAHPARALCTIEDLRYWQLLLQATSTDSTTIWSDCSNTGCTHPNQTIYSWVTTSIGESTVSKQFACCWPTRLSILRTSSCYEAITNVQASTASTASTINVRFALVEVGRRRYKIKLWKTFTDCFNCLPVAALRGDSILCKHGGLSRWWQ